MNTVTKEPMTEEQVKEIFDKVGGNIMVQYDENASIQNLVNNTTTDVRGFYVDDGNAVITINDIVIKLPKGRSKIVIEGNTTEIQ